MRILSKGADLPFVHKSVGWEEHINFKDYDIVFVNLRTLEESSSEYDHPFNDSDNTPEIFTSSDVAEFIKEEGKMVVYLPESTTVDMGESTTAKRPSSYSRSQQITPGSPPDPDPYYDYDLLDWLPVSLSVNSSEKGDSVEIFDQRWDWYFGSRFSWNKFFKVTTTRSYQVNSIAENSYGKAISLQLKKEGGKLFLLPNTTRISYSEFVKESLENIFEIDSKVEGRAPPTWVSNYSLPNESELIANIDEKRREITELESELDQLTKYKRLLYETSTNLEEVTKRALRELGFVVEGEVPGRRDGVLNTSQAKFVLEITGTTGGVKLSKCRQLDEWVEDAIVEFPEEKVLGLLIVNSQMAISPNERNVSIEPNAENYLKERGKGDYKVLLTSDLYQIVEQSLSGGVNKKLIEEMFCQPGPLLRLPPELTQ